MVFPPSSHILKNYLFWLCLVFIAARRLSLIAGYSWLRCVGFSLQWLLLLGSTDARVHGLSCSQARGVLPDQGQSSCPLPWLVDVQPLNHQGSPLISLWHKLLLVSGLASSPPFHHPCYFSLLSSMADSCLPLDKEPFLEKEGTRGR